MGTNSQFLFSYIDELVTQSWVDWMEGPLSSIPEKKFRNEKGFQKVLGSSSAGPRTRSLEAYQLGLLRGRLVKQRKAGAAFPAGWQQVISGEAPSTRLGYYAYIIGKAARENNNSDCLLYTSPSPRD